MVHQARVVHLANWAMLPRDPNEGRLGVMGDVAALRVMLSSEPEDVKRDACAYLLKVYAEKRSS